MPPLEPLEPLEPGQLPAASPANEVVGADGPVGAWTEDDFSPFPVAGEGEFFADGGRTYRVVKDRTVEVCGFVPEPLGEKVCLRDIDDPDGRTERTLFMRITTPEGVSEVEVPLREGMSRAIVAAVPSSLARLSVRRAGDVAAAAEAFASPSFFSRTTFGQTGWLPDGSFALPGDEAVDLSGINSAAGARLLRFPQAPDRDAAEAAAELLLEICRRAPVTVTAPILGTIAAAPMFRRGDHLGARGFLTLLAGPSQTGKTTLMRTMYSLVGDFYMQPGAVTTWSSTAASLEPALNTLRDLPVFVDNFRITEAREPFRRVVMALGDGATRDRGAWTGSGIRLAAGLPPKCLVLATGEQAPEDDAAISGRIIQIDAACIDKESLWQIEPERLRSLPHLYALFVAYLSKMRPEWWAYRRRAMGTLSTRLLALGEARTGENIATLTTGFVTFADFVATAFPRIEQGWRDLVASYDKELSGFATHQAARVVDERLDAVVLREVARGLRDRQIHLVQLRTAGQPAEPGKLLGGYDHEALYLMPTTLTRWASDQLRASGRRREPLGRRELGAALLARGGRNGIWEQRVFVRRAKPQRGWVVTRDGLGPEWEGLL